MEILKQNSDVPQCRSYWEWRDQFKPVSNHMDKTAGIDGCLFQSYGEEWAYVSAFEPEFIWSLIVSSGAVGGFVVSSGKFTRDAGEFANGTNIELIDGRDIVKSMEAGKKISRVTPSFDNQIETNICPRCGGEMVMRTAKRGANAGKQFWGCAAYPNCRGTCSI